MLLLLLLQGAGLLSEGSELLLEVLNPGIIGGVVLPVLGALPDSLIILTSLSAPAAEAQEQIAVGIGRCMGVSSTHLKPWQAAFEGCCAYGASACDNSTSTLVD